MQYFSCENLLLLVTVGVTYLQNTGRLIAEDYSQDISEYSFTLSESVKPQSSLSNALRYVYNYTCYIATIGLYKCTHSK